MARFLQGISEGIFGRLTEQQNEQKARDEQRRGEVLNLLAGLSDKVEPESLPLLLGHMGDVMKLQGPMKKFWQAFSGMPNRGFEDQLGTRLKDITSGIIGPEKAKQDRGAFKDQLLQPYRSSGSRPRSVEALPYKTPPSLAGKMVLRDPRAERMEEIEGRYGLQAQAALDRQLLTNQFKDLQREDTQRHQREMVDVRADSKAKQDVRERAWTKAISKGFTAPTVALEIEAANELAQEQGWTNERLQAQILELNARAAQQQAVADSMKKSGGLSPSQADTKQFREKRAAEQIKGLHGKALTDIAEAEKVMKDSLESINKALSAGQSKGKFDPNTGSITYPSEEARFAGTLEKVGGIDKHLEAYRKASAALEGAKKSAEGHYGTLKTYGKYYKVGPTFRDPVEEAKVEKPSRPAQPTPKSRGNVYKAGIGNKNRGPVTIPISNPDAYEAGGRIKYGGKWYVIQSIEGNFIKGIPE